MVFVLLGAVFGIVALSGPSDIQTLTQQAATKRDQADKIPAPDFTLKSLEGPNISLADYKGVKPVILDFWATWCPNCRRDMPVLSDLYEKYNGEVEVIAVNIQESESLVSNFVDSLGLKFKVVLDTDGAIARKYGITYTSTKVFIDVNGVVQDTFPADVTDDDFQELLATEKESTPTEPQTPQI